MTWPSARSLNTDGPILAGDWIHTREDVFVQPTSQPSQRAAGALHGNLNTLPESQSKRTPWSYKG